MTQLIAEITSDLHRLRLASPCGLVANAYVWRPDGTNGPAVLIDSGFPHTSGKLVEALTTLGIGLDGVTDVVITHTHYDHLGGAYALRNSWSPRVFAPRGCEAALADFQQFDAARADEPIWPANILPPARATDARVLEMQSKPRFDVKPPPSLSHARSEEHDAFKAATFVSPGHEVTFGSQSLRCVEAGGHDPTHVAWLNTKDRWMASGDVVMAVLTPLVRTMGDDPIQWLHTLDRLAARTDIERLLPGHGMPTTLIAPSIARARRHYVRLFDATIQALHSGQRIDAMNVVSIVLPSDPSRFAQRSAMLVATAQTTLHMLRDRGVIDLHEDNMWSATGTLPSIDELLEEEDLF